MEVNMEAELYDWDRLPNTANVNSKFLVALCLTVLSFGDTEFLFSFFFQATHITCLSSVSIIFVVNWLSPFFSLLILCEHYCYPSNHFLFWHLCRYASVRAIETKNPVDDQQWLTYWVLYSFITLFELTFAPIIEW